MSAARNHVQTSEKGAPTETLLHTDKTSHAINIKFSSGARLRNSAINYYFYRTVPLLYRGGGRQVRLHDNKMHIRGNTPFDPPLRGLASGPSYTCRWICFPCFAFVVLPDFSRIHTYLPTDKIFSLSPCIGFRCQK